MKEKSVQGVLFEKRFLEKHVGKSILNDPKVAIFELIANSWDAGSTKVSIDWPDGENNNTFCIQDNGVGLTDEELMRRWRTMSYDRRKELGDYAIFPDGLTLPPRHAFGQHGVGRFAGFYFSSTYQIETLKKGKQITYEISENSSGEFPFEVTKKNEISMKGNGTKIYASCSHHNNLAPDEISAEIGMRFLTDPNFEVFVNGNKVTFSQIPSGNISKNEITLSDGNILKITTIDTKKTDTTTKQHGVAWHVRGRLVGNCSWKGYGFEELIDGRRIEAKRYIFIITADFLKPAVLSDWSGFVQDDKLFQQANNIVKDEIKKFVLTLSKDKRKKVFNSVRSALGNKLEKMTPLRVEKWEHFVGSVQIECPSIKDTDLIKLARILANLELSNSKFKLINQLHALSANQLDSLHDILSDWTVDYAKEILDELKIRIALLDELERKVLDEKTDEVHELQPLFHQGLWIFGPQFETIEFTSNQGMTAVIQKIFGEQEIKGSKNRPDFAVLPDGSLGTYFYPSYDNDFAEIGVQELVIVELKKPGVKISEKEMSQCWKYVKELYKKGLIQKENTKVTCFALGSAVDPFEGESTKNNEMVRIIPLDYNIIIKRAKSRLLKLYDRVKEAPFLKDKNVDSEQGAIQKSLF